VSTAGSVQERFSYTAYGESTVLNADRTVKGGGSGYAWEHRYIGRILDPTSGLQLNRNRYFHQQIGRWCSRDPIGYEGSKWNLCEHVHGKPIRYRDPSGRAAGIWNKFCEACRGAYEVGPFDAWGAAGIWGSGIGGDAQDFARTFDDPGESNAARHCYWQAILTIHYGPDAAKGICDAHEYGEDGNPDSVVDQFNNPIGRAIGGSVRGNEDIPCSERPKAVVADCTRAIRDGTLAVSPADPRLGLPRSGDEAMQRKCC